MILRQQTIFDYCDDTEAATIERTEPSPCKGKREVFEDYEAFVEKFKPKKTTDDCYTPPEIYDAVVEWVGSEIMSLDGLTIRRPFKPGGDYISEAGFYGPKDVVIDNPPFSILSQIVDFYTREGVLFFLFAPGTTLFSSPRKNCTYIVVGASLVYENKAEVCTSFITNMEGKHRVIVAGDLCKKLDRISDQLRKREVKVLKKRIYPDSVITAALLQKISKRGITYKIPMEEAHFIRKMENQSGSLFGGGYLISERAAAERAAAERAAAERAALSPKELEIIQNLSTKNRKNDTGAKKPDMGEHAKGSTQRGEEPLHGNQHRQFWPRI